MNGLVGEEQLYLADIQRTLNRAATVRARALARQESRPFDDGVMEAGVGAPIEDLCCPQCRQTFRFGDACPTCSVFLVSSSFVDSAPPQKVVRSSWTAANVMLGVGLLAVEFAFLALIF